MTECALVFCYHSFEVIVMIILYGGIDMLIKRIHIAKLHGRKDYKLKLPTLKMNLVP